MIKRGDWIPLINRGRVRGYEEGFGSGLAWGGLLLLAVFLGVMTASYHLHTFGILAPPKYDAGGIPLRDYEVEDLEAHYE